MPYKKRASSKCTCFSFFPNLLCGRTHEGELGLTRLLGLSGFGFWGNTASETVLCSSGNVFHVSHSASSLTLSSRDLEGPVEDSGLSSRVTASSAGVLLLVESGLTASSAESVSLCLSKTERGGTFSVNHL